MFYNRVQLKKSALLLLKPNWNKAALVGLCVALPLLLFYALYIVWFFKFVYKYDNAPADFVFKIFLQFIPFLIGFISIGAILGLALCRWSIQLAKSADSENPDAPSPPTLKDFFSFFSPISIPIVFWCFLKQFLWQFVLMASMIPLSVSAAILQKSSIGILLIFPSLVLLFFVYLVVIAKAISYSMALYAYADNPNLSVTETTKVAVQVTDGFRTNLFVTQLSFIGWYMLTPFTLGVALFWVLPYYTQVMANAWLFMKKEKEALESDS